jgi:hypothetical protein
MKKEEIAVVAQLLTAIKDAIEKLEEAKRNSDTEQFATAKNEILIFQKKLGELL